MRRLVYLSAETADALSTDGLYALLDRAGARHGDDALLVVACGLDLPRVEALAHAAGWQHCQYWADGQARAAVHVLERRDAAWLRAR